ncbi:MAG: hypothetical protein ACE3JK_01135 [Sporolactobacillus sp.]
MNARLILMIRFLLDNLHTLLFLLGLVLIVWTVFLISRLAGLFTLAGVLILIGLLLNPKPPGGR